MKGFIISAGSRWKAPSIRHAENRLVHRGDCRTILKRRTLTIKTLGGGLEAHQGEGFTLWVSGIEAEHLGEAKRLAQEGNLAKKAPSQWRAGFFLLLDDRTQTLTLLRGEFSNVPVQFVTRKADLFIAPETKAFSNISRHEKIRRLKPGHSFVFNLRNGECQLIDGTLDWPEPEVNGSTYEEEKQRYAKLAEAAVANSLALAPRPIALALSGGLDSALVALLARDAGFRLPAFHVSFRGEGLPASVDLQSARALADFLDLDLHEILISEEDLEPLIEEMIYRSEATRFWEMAGTLHWLVLGKRLESEGYAACLTGNGPDCLLGSHLEMYADHLTSGFHKSYVSSFRALLNPEHENALMESFAFDVLSPLKDESMIDHALQLPREFMVGMRNGMIQSKILVRDICAERLPGELGSTQKITPAHGNNLAAVLDARFGSEEKRNHAIKRLRRRTLKPEELGWRSTLQKVIGFNRRETHSDSG